MVSSVRLSLRHSPLAFTKCLCLQADDPKEAAKDILARAAARGIIKGVPVQEIKGKGSKSGRKKDKDKTKGGRQKRGGKKGAEVHTAFGRSTSSQSAPEISMRKSHMNHTPMALHRHTLGLPPPLGLEEPAKPSKVEHSKPFR